MKIFFQNILSWISKNYHWLLVLILVLSVFVSLAHSFYFQIEPIVDARAYDSIATDFLETGQYPEGAIGRPGPGYEFFLAAIYSVFGRNYPVVWIIQAFLLAFAAAFTFFTAKEVFKETWHPLIGLVAATLVGLSPDLIIISSMLMTETLLLFLISAAVLLFFKYVNSGNIALLSFSAALVSLSALVRGNISILILPILTFLIWKKQWWAGIVFAAIFFLCLIPWTIHNYQAYGVIKPFDASAGLLYVGNHPGATSELIPDYPLPASITDNMSQLEFDNTLGQAGVEYIISHPLDFIKLTFWRLSIYFSFARPFAFWPHLDGFSRLATIVLSSAYSLLVFILGFLGTVASLRKRVDEKIKSNLWLLFWIMLAMPLAIVALVVETRYRFPIYPLLAVFGGYGIWLIASNWRQTVKPLVITAAILGANTVFDIIRNWQRILDKINHI